MRTDLPLLRGARHLAFGLALLLGSCGSGPPPPSIVVITLDTTRADHLGCYGYFRDTTPHLDAFAAEALVFDRCIAPMATTLPTHTSLLTGTFPLEHGVLANATQGGQRFVPSASLRTLAELCADAGYRTGAFVSAAPLKSDSGIAEGYERFSQPTAKNRVGTETVDDALEWLDGVRGEPIHLWVHFYDAHYPYNAPPPYRGTFQTDADLEAHIAERGIHPTAYRPLVQRTEEAREVINAYDDELLYQDAEFGRLLAALRARPDWEDMLVLVVADHGEGLCQHGEAAHGGTWDEQVRVPLFLKVPGVAPGRVDETLAVVDVLPTALGALWRAGGPAFQPLFAQASGRDVLAEDGRTVVVSQDTGRDRENDEYRYAITTDRWKYLRIEQGDGGIRHELYDLTADPFELRDVALEHPDRVATFGDLLEETLAGQRARADAFRDGKPPETREMSAELARELEALGYAGGTSGGDQDG